MNKSASKKTLIASAAAISLSALLFAGTTYAWFTDSASSAVSTIKSGNLDVNLYQLQKTTTEDADGNKTETSTYKAVTNSDIVFAENTEWEPGAVEVVYLKVANEGTLALTYNLSLPIYENIHATSVTNEDIDLSTVLKAAVVNLGSEETFNSREAALAAAKTGTSITLGTSSALTGNLEAKKDDTFAIVVYMPETTGNEANHNADGTPSIKVGVNVAAKQYTKESDSYNDQYDANAEYGSDTGYPVTASTFTSLLTSGGNLTLAEDVTVTNSYDNGGYLVTEVIKMPEDTVLDMLDNSITSVRYGLALVGKNVTVKNGTFQGVLDEADYSYAVTIGDYDGKAKDTDNFVLENVTVKGGLEVCNAKNVILRNCYVEGAVDTDDGNGGSTIASVGSGTTVTIESGTYVAGRVSNVPELLAGVNMGTIVVKGGTFDNDPSYFVAKGYKAVKGDDGWYTVVPETAD